MKRALLVLLAFAVAALSIGIVWFVLVLHVMRSIPPVLETTMAAALAVILAALGTALLLGWRGRGGWIYRGALAVMLIAGLAPAALYWRLSVIEAANRKVAEAKESAERGGLQYAFLKNLSSYKTRVEAHISQQQPLSPQEAQRLLDFMANLSNRFLSEYSPEALSVLKQALDGKVLDPNVRVKGPRMVDTEEEPLFVVYYKFYLQSGATMHVRRVREREWKIFQMLIAAGANLDDPAAAVLRDVVNRETEPYDPNVPGYIRLK